MPLFGWTDADVYQVADRAHQLYLQGRYREASILFEGLVAVDPESRYCGNALAGCLMSLGDASRAVQVLNRLLARYSDDLEGRVRRCEALLQLGRVGEAAADLQTLRQRNARSHVQRLELRMEAARSGLLPAS
ncbi:MAG: tetratricopeptide repeat protein [Acidobacteria bacterium]|nr:tetratricopeptide repeat protein [Acidobacteriota bacterium]